MVIGGWGRRRKGGYKWHLIESVIAGDMVTKCGRRMHVYASSKWDYTSISRIGTQDACKQCV